MSIRLNSGARWLGIAATAALAFGLATAGRAGAATGSTSVANDTLTVNGTRGVDRLALRLAGGDPNTLQVDFGDDGSADQSIARSTFSHIDVSLKGGDDQFHVDEANGPIADEGLLVDGGGGADTMVGGSGNDLLLGGRGIDVVTGARGNDTALLGPGRDSFTWAPGEGSDSIEGGSGRDSLAFAGSNASEIMSLSANGDRSLFLRDVGAIRMDLNDVETLDLATLGGADRVVIDDLSGFRNANIDLSAAGVGDGQADIVTANGSAGSENVTVAAAGARVDVRGFSANTHVTGSEITDRLLLDGRGGDTLRVGSGVAGLIGVVFGLGAGQV